MKRYVDQPELIEKEGKLSLENVRPYLPDSVMSHLQDIYLNMLEVKR